MKMLEIQTLLGHNVQLLHSHLTKILDLTLILWTTPKAMAARVPQTLLAVGKLHTKPGNP